MTPPEVTGDPGVSGSATGTWEVAIVGGGIGGLASAHFLAMAGARVTLYEASDQLGGLGTFFKYQDTYLERFYHCMLPTDRHLLGLLRDVGLDSDTYWKETSFGYIHGRDLYPLNTPLQLLQFSVLPFRDRLRVGLTGLWGRLRSSDGLDDITCAQWLTRLSGRRAFDAFWRPMLEAKFGDRYDRVPALWFWTRFNREKGGKRERKGYVRGGYRRIALAVAESVRAKGGTIRMATEVQRLDLAADGRPLLCVEGESPRVFDQVLFTAPLFFLHKTTTGGRLAHVVERADSGIDMQGVVNAVFLLRRGLTPHYWVAAVDEAIPFQGIVESTTLLDKSDTAGAHLVYVMNYVHRSAPRFQQSDSEVMHEYWTGLKALFPDLRDDDLIDRFVFRSPFVEPIYTTGYLSRKPPTELLPGRVYLATAAQVYPDVTSWNGATRLAREVTDRLLRQRGAA